MRRVLCWIFGHRWRVTAEQPRWALYMAHLCCDVGRVRECQVCGEVLDFTNPDVGLWGPVLSPQDAMLWWLRLSRKPQPGPAEGGAS